MNVVHMSLINLIWCRCTWRMCIPMTTHGSHTWRAITNVSTVQIHTTWTGKHTTTLPFIC